MHHLWETQNSFNQFSIISELHPKLWTLVGASGVHTVCVYVRHQKIIVIVQGAQFTVDFNAKKPS